MMRLPPPRFLFALLLTACAGGTVLRTQTPPADVPAAAQTPADAEAKAKEPAGETVEVDAERPRAGEAASDEAESGAGEVAEEWERPGEIGPPNHWQFTPPPSPQKFAAGFSADLPPVEAPSTDHRVKGSKAHAGGKLHGNLQFFLEPFLWNGRPRTLMRQGTGGITTVTGTDQFAAGAMLVGSLLQERLDFEVSYQHDWWRTHERLALADADQALDQVTATWANRGTSRGWRETNIYSLALGWSPGLAQRLTLRLHGAPAQQSGALRGLGRRLWPANDAGERGTPPVDPVDGTQGSRRLHDQAVELQYLGVLPHHLELEAAAAWHESYSDETPDAAADQVLFIDNRRPRLYYYQALNGLAPVTTPAQYRYGGFGFYDGGNETRTLAFHLQLAQRFIAAGAHQLKYGVQYADHRVGENYVLNSGPRGEGGPLAALYTSFYDWTGGIARLRRGAFAEANCAASNPAAGDFSSACPDTIYALVRAPLNPQQPLAFRRDWSLYAQDEWRVGRMQLSLGLRYLRSRLEQHGDYSLLGALTGQPLLGPDGNPVGTRDPDNPFESAGGEPDLSDPRNINSPRYVAGPGRFVGGGYRFPAALSPRLGWRWDLAGKGKSWLYLGAARLYDELPDELVHRAFSSEFGVARASFANPDFTDQYPGTITYGGLLRAVQPNTRLGYADHYRGGWRWENDGMQVEIEGRHRRQGRILAITQASAMEEIANFTYERQIRLRQCQNCDSYPLFPDYPAGISAAARGFLAPTLANPGDNTPAGLFGNPARREQSLTVSLRKEAEAGGHFSWDAQGRIARARGNYAGVMIQTNGSGEEKIASLFDYPLSHLTRSQYAEGPLDPDDPSSFSLKASWRDAGVKGLTTELAWRWRQGTLRTPMVRSPFSSYLGLLPGSDPQYYRFAQAIRGYTDLLVLRDFTPAQRGALGRNPAAAGWDLAASYRLAAGRGTFALRLEIRNLFNQTRVLSYDDAVEPEPGYLDPVSSGPSGESLRPAGALTNNGVDNPVYGRPATAQLPRQIRFGAEWSF